MRANGAAGRHRVLRSGTAAGVICLSLLAGGLVGGISPAQAATIPPNPCVRPEPVPVTTSPVVTRVSTRTRVVDVRRRAKTLRVTVRAHDTVAITRVVVTVSELRPIGKTVGFTATAALVSGTSTDGTWQAAVLLPRYIPAGTYRVSRVLVRDVGGGRSAYYRSTLPDAWPARLRVRSVTDRRAPVVTGFRVSARAVDTRSAPTTLTLRVRARDDLSGVARVKVGALGIDPASAPTQPPATGFGRWLTRSTDDRHLWVGRVVVPMWAGISTWNLSVKVVDVRGHKRTLHLRDLARRGWQSTLRVTSRRDPVQPTLVAVSFSPTTVDARSGAVRVDVTFRVTDPLSGPADRATFMFVGDRTGAADMVITSITGLPTDRTYHGYAIVPRCGAALSTWRALVDLYDNATNENWVGPAELASLGFPNELEVRQFDTLAPFVSSTDGLLAGQSLTLRFTEPVLVAAPMAGTLAVTVDRAPAAGSWQCRDGTDQVVVCDADGADVVTASFTPTTPFEAGDELTVRPVAVHPARTGIYDLDGVPMVSFTVLRTVS